MDQGVTPRLFSRLFCTLLSFCPNTDCFHPFTFYCPLFSWAKKAARKHIVILCWMPSSLLPNMLFHLYPKLHFITSFPFCCYAIPSKYSPWMRLLKIFVVFLFLYCWQFILKGGKLGPIEIDIYDRGEERNWACGKFPHLYSPHFCSPPFLDRTQFHGNTVIKRAKKLATET